MSTPIWFDETYYMQQKLAQVNGLGMGLSMQGLYAAFADAGFKNPYDHYLAYGDAEGIAPNALFNPHNYLKNKAAAVGLPEATTAASIRDAGFTLAEHYDLYGARECVSPSDAFDQSKYYQAKLYQVQASNPNATLDDIVKAFTAANLTPLEHYMLFAASEGLTEANANAAGYSYAVTDNRPVANPNKTNGFEYTIDYNSHTVHTVTVEKTVTEITEDGNTYYRLETVTVDLSETTEVTDITIIGSTPLDLSGVLDMIGA